MGWLRGDGQRGFQFGRRLRLAKEVALQFIHPQPLQQRRLFGGLHPFRHHALVERLGQGDDGGGNGQRRALHPEGKHKALVDLEGVERQLAQVAHGRVAHTEVVQRDGHAQRTQCGQALDGGIDIANERALGDFQFQFTGLDVELLQQGLQLRRQRRIGQLQG